MKARVVILAISILAGLTSSSQSVSRQLLGSGGDIFINQEYRLEWSLGELSTETYSNSSLVLNQGFHQGKFLITAVESNKDLNFNIEVYPNPTNDFISLKSEFPETENVQYVLTNVSGKILLSGIIKNPIEQIDFSKLESGVYFLTLKHRNQLVKTFKIIKI
jgi:hypothetical protein